MAGNGSLRSTTNGSSSLVSSNGAQSPQTIFLKVFIPDKNCEHYFRFEPTETVDQAKRRVLDTLGSGLNDPLNYGFFQPPADGRFGKFLGEDRLLRDFGFGSSNGVPALIEFRYKRRLYKAPVSVKKLKQTHSRTNVKAFIDAVRHGDVERVSRWLDKWLDPNLHDKNGDTPLGVAVQHVTGSRCRNVLLALVSGGAHLDFRAHDSQTAMHRAAICGNNDAVEALLDLGASPNVLDRVGATPLCMAVKTCADERIVRRLLFDHAVLNVPDVNGDRELHIACRNDANVRLVDVLLEYGAEMDTPNAAGNTPLHVSAMFGALECARHLLFRGADRTRLNNVGQTAHQCALINSNRPLADLIAGWADRDVVPLRDSPRYNNRRNSSALPSVRAAIQRRSSVSNLFEIADRLSSASLPSASSLADVSATSQPPDTPTASASGYLADTGRRLSVASSGALSATPMHSSTGAPDADGYFVVGEHRVRHDERFVSIQRGPNGYGFVLRGAKPPPSSPAATRLAFVPTPLQPSLQFLENVDPAEPAGRAGLCDHDYIVEVNGERVVDATHDQTVELIKRSRNGVLLMRVVRVIVDSSPPATISSPATPASLRRAPLRRNASKSLIDEPLYAYPPNQSGTATSTRSTASPPRHAGTVGVSGGAYLTSQLSGEYADPRRTPPIGAVSKSASVSNGLHAIGNGTASLYLDGPAADTYAYRSGNGSNTAGRRSPLAVAPPQLRRVAAGAGAASQVDLENMFESLPEAARSLSSFPAGAQPNGLGLAQPPFGFTDEAIRSKLRQNAVTTNSSNSSPHPHNVPQPVVVRTATTGGDLPSIGTLDSIPRVPVHASDKAALAASAANAAGQRDLITTQALVHHQHHYNMPPPPELPAPTLSTHTGQNDHVSEAILPPRDYDDHFVVSASTEDPEGNVFLPPPDYDTEPTSHDAPDSAAQLQLQPQPTAPLALAQGVRYVLTGVSQPPPPPPPPAPPAPPENQANGFFSDLQRAAFEKQQRRTATALVNESGDLVATANSTPNGETEAAAARRRELPVGVTREHDMNLKAALSRRREVIELSGEDNVARAIETQIKQGRTSAVYSYTAGGTADSATRLSQLSNVPSSPSTMATSTKSGSDTSASTSTSGVKSAATTRSNTSQSSPSSSLSASQSSSSVASGNATLTAPRKLPAPLPPPKTSSLAAAPANDAASNHYASLNSSKSNMMPSSSTNTAQRQTSSTINGIVPSTAPPKRDLNALLAMDNQSTAANVAPQPTTATATNGKLQTIEKSTKPNVVPSARITNVPVKDETDSVTFLPQAAAKPPQNASALPANNVSTIAAAVFAARNADAPTSATNTGVKNATPGTNRMTYIAGFNKPNVSTAATPAPAAAAAASITKQDGTLTSKPAQANVQSTQAANGSSSAPLNGAVNGKPPAADSTPLTTSGSGSNFKQLAEELRKQYIDTQREQYQRLNLLVTQLTSSANSYVAPTVSSAKPVSQTNVIANPNVNGAAAHAPVPPPNSPLKSTSA